MGAKPRTLLTNNVDLTVVPEPNVKKQPSAASQPKVLRKLIETGFIPGVVALVADDRGVFYEGAFGLRDEVVRTFHL